MDFARKVIMPDPLDGALVEQPTRFVAACRREQRFFDHRPPRSLHPAVEREGEEGAWRISDCGLRKQKYMANGGL